MTAPNSASGALCARSAEFTKRRAAATLRKSTDGYFGKNSAGRKQPLRWRHDRQQWQHKHNLLLFVVACTECRREHIAAISTIRCVDCRRERDRLLREGEGLAHQKVADAIKRGLLHRPSEFECIDCGEPATVYDHRDYSLPLSVQPVCRSCNCLRGMGARIPIKQRAHRTPPSVSAGTPRPALPYSRQPEGGL